MEKKLRELFDLIVENKVRRALALALAIVVTFSTTYSLVLPAITLEKDTAETMSGISMGGNEQAGDTSSSSEGEDADEGDSDGGEADKVAFDAEAKNEDGETEALVHVEADADAFPEGTTMEATVVTDQDVIDSITETAEGEVVAVHAVDLAFTDEKGEAVRPAEGSQISVTLSAGEGVTSETEKAESAESDADAEAEENAAEAEKKAAETEDKAAETEQNASEAEEKDAEQSSAAGNAQDAAAPEDQTTESAGEEAAAEQATETTVIQYTEDNGAEQVETNDEVSFQVEPENDLDQDNAVSFDMGEQTGGQDTQTYAIVETVAEDAPEDETGAVDPDAENPQEVSAEEIAAEPEVPLEEAPDFSDTVLTAQDESYVVTVSYGPEAGIPEDASLKVEEILSEDKNYEDHLDETQKALNDAAQAETAEAAEAEGIYAGPETEEPQFFGVSSLMSDPDAFERQQAEAAAAPEPEIVYARFFDITILDADGNEVEPAAPVKVSIELLDTEQDEQVLQNADAAQVVHFGEEETEVVQAEVLEDAVAGVTFDAEGFSVYGVVYTVDLHYEVNGELYEFSIPGGGFVSLEHIVEVLGIATDGENTDNGAENDTKTVDESVGEVPSAEEDGENHTIYEESVRLNELEVSEAAKKFVEDVESVEFSDPELVWVGKVDSTATVGGLKEANGLEVEYSAELTEEQIAEINSSTVEAGDWALISVHPFTSEEMLTITMKNGNKWIIRVSDNQMTSLDEINKNETYVIYTVQNNTTYVLKTDGTTEPLGNRSLDMLDNNYKWTILWRYTDYGDNNKKYYSVIPQTDPYKAMSLSWFKDDLVKDSNTNQIYIEAGSNNTFYFGGYNHVVLAFENGSFQGRHGPWYWRWERTGWDYSTLPWTPIYSPVEIDDVHYTNNNDTEHSAVPVFIYKQEAVDTYEFYVKTDSLKQGYIIGTDKDGQPFSDNNIVEHVTVTNNNKKNQYEIKAVTQSDKYLFDYWDLDGVKQTYGATIPANTIPITANGNILTAHFTNNPDWNPEVKPGREVDEAKLLEWINGLKNQDHLMDPDGFSKTAEVYDYENRVYRIDLTAKSDFTTISGVADLGFVLDVSSSMRFPASLTEYRKNGQNVRIKANDLWNTNSSAYRALSRDQTYYLIADETSTATVFRLNYSNGTWHRQDASKTGDGDAIDSNTAFQGETGKTYQIYIAEGEARKHDDYNNITKRLDYLNWSISNTDTSSPGLIQELQDILNNYLSRGATDDDKANEPEVKIAYNTFHKTLQANDYTFRSVKTNTPTITTNPGGGTSTDAGLLAAAGYKRNDSGYNTKDMKSYSAYTPSDDRISGYPNLIGATEFKENSMFSKDSSVGFNWDPNSSKYVVLITDGAPQRNGKDIEAQMVKDAANYLKAGEDGILGTDDDVTLITVGLSMGNVKKGANLLWELADRDENNDPYFYDAQDPSDLKNVLYEILQTVTGKAIVVGNVTDTINDAFYPVDVRTGAPLENGYVIDLKGNWIANNDVNLTPEQKAAGYGVISKGTDGLYKVTWTGQDFVPTEIGWHGTVYVKAKEDFFGGNTVRTNYNDAEFKATGYKGKPGDVTVDLAEKYQEEKKQESPYVNVDELHFTDNSTEWTVYLGTEVNPKKELQGLFDKIEIEEDVLRATADKTRVNGNEEQYRYEYLADNTEDKRTEKPGDPVKFTLAELFGKLPQSEQDKIDWDTLISLADQPVKPKVNQGEPEPEEPEGGWNTGITLDYKHYNQDYPGTITIMLVKDHDPNKHVTDQVGDAVETYTLSVLFSPDYTHLSKDQGGQGDVEYHTGKYGTGSEGVGAGTEESTNTHTINVFAKDIEITKTNGEGTIILNNSATFALYRKDSSGAPVDGLPSGNYVKAYKLITSTDGKGVLQAAEDGNPDKLVRLANDAPYYLVEKTPPNGYAAMPGYLTVNLTFGSNIDSFTDLKNRLINGNPIQSNQYPFNWKQDESKITVTLEATNDNSQMVSGTNGIYSIKNYPGGVELPYTGGPGTELFKILGTACVLGAGVLLIRKKRAE